MREEAVRHGDGVTARAEGAGPSPRRARGRPRLEDAATIDSTLLDVALREFLANGYGATSMRRIVQAANISKTTLYSRFASKEQLFRAIMRQQIDRVAAADLLKLRGGTLDLQQGLCAYANRTLELSLSGELLQVNRLIFSESQRFPELGAAAAERTHIGVCQVADFIRDCAEADGVPCRDPNAIAEAFILMIRGWYVSVMLTDARVPAKDRAQWVDKAVHCLIVGRADW